MRPILFFLFLHSFTGWGQVFYTSEVTRHFPSEEVENIRKIIEINESFILINTFDPAGTEKKDSLTIHKKFRRNLDDVLNSGESMIYHCLSRDKLTEYIITIPETSEVEFIDVYIPEQTNRKSEYYRLLLN